MADTTEKTIAEELQAAMDVLSPDSPVHAEGTARILHAPDSDGYDVLIAICDQHDDPDNPPPGSQIHGQCGNCVFVKLYDRDLAKQLAALINAREPLAAWLKSRDGVELREDGPLPSDFEHALRIARVLNGTTERTGS